MINDLCLAEPGHPDIELIENLVKWTGGYPAVFGCFAAEQVARAGATLDIHYKVTVDELPPLMLRRLYCVISPVTAIGVCIEGPIVRDDSLHRGHRLATKDELVPMVDNNTP